MPALESGLDEYRQALPQPSGNLGGIAPELDVYRVQRRPQTSCWRWFQALLPVLTGRASRHPDRWSRVRSVSSRSPPAAHDLQLKLPVEIAPADSVDDEAEVLDRFPAEAKPVQRSEVEAESRIQVQR